MKRDVFDQLEAHFKSTKKWKSLDGAYINFTHWTLVRGDHGSLPYQKDGFYVSWLRHTAYICQTNFPSIDLVIPMAFRNHIDVVNPECMSYIVISVKSCTGTEEYEKDFLSKEAVEGVIVLEDTGKGKGKDDDDNGKDKPKPKYTHSNENLNIRLTLHAVKFINPDGVYSARTNDDQCWIRPTADKPYIAFAMSMKQIERTENLFVAEKNVTFYTSRSDLLEYWEFTSYCVRLERSHEHI